MQKKESMNAITMLKDDHKKVKEIFGQFEKEKDHRNKRKLAQEVINELKIHSALEEEIFYPKVRKEIDDLEIMNEATEEHHVAKVLIAELDQMKGNSDVYVAKFTVLAENIRHHIKEEEGGMFPEIKKSKMDLEELGEIMIQRKQELVKKGVPPTPEESMVRSRQNKLDVPTDPQQGNPADFISTELR